MIFIRCYGVFHTTPLIYFFPYLGTAQLCRMKFFFQVRGRLCHRAAENGEEQEENTTGKGQHHHSFCDDWEEKRVVGGFWRRLNENLPLLSKSSGEGHLLLSWIP